MVSRGTNALESAIRIHTTRNLAAVVAAVGAFVHVATFVAVTNEAVGTLTLESAVGVGTVCVGVAVVCAEVAFVLIHAGVFD